MKILGCALWENRFLEIYFKNGVFVFLGNRTLSQLEPEFKSTYRNLSKQVQDFATDLLDQTRGSEELETILNHDTETPVTDEDTEAMTLSRLRLAIKYKQKEV